MSWYNTLGPCPNYVLFSKVRYIRNLAKHNFSHLLDHKRAQEATGKLDSILTANGFRGESTVSGINPAILSLAERQLVERDFVYSEHPRSLYLNDPCNLVIAIGGDEFISISSVIAGLSVIEAKNMASEAEEMIDREMPSAYSERIGYLSPICSNCGSGICFSAALYLPSLSLRGTESVTECLSSRGMTLAPMFAHAFGNLYTISYIPHFLADEDAAAVFFSDTVSSLAEKEKSELGILFEGKGKIIYGDARRALGSMLYCESMSESEMLNHISTIRLCLCLGSDPQASLPTVSDLNFLCAEGLNASVVATAKELCSSREDCELIRASLLSRYIEHKSEVS